MPLRENKIAPAFFIGLGGCGGAIVDELSRKMKQDESFERYKDLLHFFALDTDGDDLARLAFIDTAHRFLLSDFDKPEYVDLKQGKLHAKPDELFTQWWPAYYRPRDTRGKGAGQIRLESRLSLYHHLENDSAKILETLEKAIRRAYDVHNPFRANKAAKVYVYASLAGGTGSGGFAMMAYTMRRLLGGQRGHQLIGTFVLPNVFKSKGLPPNQFDKIMANGYSALQELELLQSARPEAPIAFHHDPDHPERRLVDRPPFDQVYLVEEKTRAGVVIANPHEIYPAIADAAHAQIFSHIIDREGSTLDNDTRELMQLDEQAFTKSFGSFGISALVLPTQDILDYCAVRLGSDLLAGAIPGGKGAALGDGADLESADAAFVNGFEARAMGQGDDALTFRRAVEWARGGGAQGGEGAVAAFLRRCKENVQKQIDAAIKVRAWEDAELATFEKDPERVESETASAWGALSGQITKSEDAARERARQAAAEVSGNEGDLSLSQIGKGKGPAEARYFYAVLRQALLAQNEETRKAYDRALTLSDTRVQEDFRRRVDRLKAAAPETLLEKLPGRTNDYFEVASEFAAWYREIVAGLRGRVRANAMLEFGSAVLKELDRRRTSSFHFFARVDRIQQKLEQRAERLLAQGGERREGGEANQFVLDVEVLQDHRSGKRLWEHVYKRIVRPSDAQLSGALSRLAEVASGAAAAGAVKTTGKTLDPSAPPSGSEQDIQRRIVEELLKIATSTLRARIAGGRDEPGLRLDEELAFEARVVAAGQRLAEDGSDVPAPGDAAWIEEIARTTPDEIAAYVRDKLDHAASKCQPFITLNAGAPLLPDKAYVVMHADYQAALGKEIRRLSSHKIDEGAIIFGEDPRQVIFYFAQLGCPLHAVKSLPDYERRYLAVKQKELAEGANVAGLPKGVPQIPIHQDRNWEGAPDDASTLFRISIEGVRENQAKIAWAERAAKRREQSGEAAAKGDDLRDFTLAVALGLIKHQKEGPAGEGYYLDDPDLAEGDRRLGKFRDQAFVAYRGRVEAQRAWARKATAARLGKLEEDREMGEIAAILDAHVAGIEKQLKSATGPAGKPVADHLGRELAATLAFRNEKGW